MSSIHINQSNYLLTDLAFSFYNKHGECTTFTPDQIPSLSMRNKFSHASTYEIFRNALDHQYLEYPDYEGTAKTIMAARSWEQIILSASIALGSVVGTTLPFWRALNSEGLLDNATKTTHLVASVFIAGILTTLLTKITWNHGTTALYKLVNKIEEEHRFLKKNGETLKTNINNKIYELESQINNLNEKIRVESEKENNTIFELMEENYRQQLNDLSEILKDYRFARMELVAVQSFQQKLHRKPTSDQEVNTDTAS